MRRFRTRFVLLAALLAVLMPLEQAHCAWMNLERAAAAPHSATGHSCCTAAGHHGAARTNPCKLPERCACIQLPPGAVPAVAAATDLDLGAPAANLDSTPSAGPPPAIAAPTTALDIGSPPLPITLGAHGTRAPPLSA